MPALITQVLTVQTLLTHFLDEDPNEFPCITLSEYVDEETFGKQLSQVKSKLSILSLNILETHLDENDSH